MGSEGQTQWVQGLGSHVTPTPTPGDKPHLLGSQDIEVAATAVY